MELGAASTGAYSVETAHTGCQIGSVSMAGLISPNLVSQVLSLVTGHNNQAKKEIEGSNKVGGGSNEN